MMNTFDTVKQSIIDDNEQMFGAEVRERYGDHAADASNAHIQGMTQEQFNEGERLRVALEGKLRAAVAAGDPSCAAAQEACDLHRQWLRVFYPSYTKQYHVSLGEMYADDERFKAHYEKIALGCAEFLRDAINIFCETYSHST
ncbi:MAG: TipAS antibiotic-recognition domain-containing protein [Defluviitaleaceae bacterium]|nr:TipAS antibiotic-recognition domain-containing protein [Defluviitaleaceae bacterium]